MMRKRNLVVDAITSGKSIGTDGESTSAKFIKLDEAANVDMQLLYTKPSDFLSLEGIYSRADIGSIFPGSTEKQNGLRAALMYANKLTSAYNSGDTTALRSIIDEICEPSCMLLTHVTHVQEDKTFPDLVIPAGRLFDYFQAITDSFPDGLWTVEESRAKLEGPMVVSSKFQFIGIVFSFTFEIFYFVSNIFHVFVSTRNYAEGRVRCGVLQLQSRRTSAPYSGQPGRHQGRGSVRVRFERCLPSEQDRYQLHRVSNGPVIE